MTLKHFVRRTFILAATLAMIPLNAQEIKQKEASIENYIELLNASGYQAYSFDISDLKNETYILNFEIREYVNGVMTDKTLRRGSFENRIMVQDFMWRELSDEELALIKADSYDYEQGIYAVADQVTIGFMPSKNDSTMVGQISVANMGSSRLELPLKPIQNQSLKEPVYQYDTKPFKSSSFQTDRFIPLVLYLSFWYDQQWNIIRCCGEEVIDPEMTAEILQYSPHFYVIGVTVTK